MPEAQGDAVVAKRGPKGQLSAQGERETQTRGERERDIDVEHFERICRFFSPNLAKRMPLFHKIFTK